MHIGNISLRQHPLLQTNGHGESPPQKMKQRYAMTVPPLPNPLPVGEGDKDSLCEFHVNQYRPDRTLLQKYNTLLASLFLCLTECGLTSRERLRPAGSFRDTRFINSGEFT